MNDLQHYHSQQARIEELEKQLTTMDTSAFDDRIAKLERRLNNSQADKSRHKLKWEMLEKKLRREQDDKTKYRNLWMKLKRGK